MTIRVKLFASLRKKLGKSELELDLPATGQIQDVLLRLGLSPNDSFIIMTNGIHSHIDQELREGDVVSIFPMVAGG